MVNFFRKRRLFLDILVIIFLGFLGIQNLFFEDTPDEAQKKTNLILGITALLMATIKMIDLIFFNKKKEKIAE